VPSKSYKRWNFRKANWDQYNLITDRLAKQLQPPTTSNVDRAYQDFYNLINTALKELFSMENQRNTAATMLLARFDENRKER